MAVTRAIEKCSSCDNGVLIDYVAKREHGHAGSCSDVNPFWACQVDACWECKHMMQTEPPKHTQFRMEWGTARFSLA